MKNEAQVRIYPSITKMIRDTLPEHKREQRLTPIVNDLLYEALDNRIKLGKPSPSGAQEGAGFTSNKYIEDKEKENSEFSTANEEWIKKHKKTDNPIPHAFLQFWKTYNRSTNKAGQSRKKALEEWPKALEKVESSQKLIEAAQKAVQDQNIQMEVEGKCLMLPDAFRWLRDEKFISLLEDNTVSKQQQPFDSKTIL